MRMEEINRLSLDELKIRIEDANEELGNIRFQH